jgi:predicted nucleic acid-binding protein
VIFFDSWAWLEVTLEGANATQAKKILERGEQEGAIVATTVLAEVYYVLDREKGTEAAEKAMTMITEFENLDVLPITPSIAIRGAQLRRKYYSQADDRTPSYADMIHLATAEEVAGCDLLYTGDSDFEDITEIKCQIL